MSPALALAVDAARDLAWRPHANLRPLPMLLRHESHDRLCAALRDLTAADRLTGPIELILLTRAMQRVAGCSFASRIDRKSVV